MAGDLLIEFFAENDCVLAIARQECLFRVSGVPNPRLRHEVKADAIHHSGPVPLGVGSEEDRSSEDALERSDQPPVLRTALLYSECIQHFSGAVERDPRRLLADCHRR